MLIEALNSRVSRMKRDVIIMTPVARPVRAAIACAAAAFTLSLSSPSHADPLAPIWTGAYIGAHAGGTWSDLSVTDFGNMSASALTGGGHAGYNFQLGRIVAGVEADFSFNGTDQGFTLPNGGAANLSSDWTSSLRGRVGLPIGPALVYATAGIAWTGTSLTETNAAGFSLNTGHTFTGAVYGVGAETYVMPNMSLRIEALRYDFSGDKLSLTGAKNVLQEFDPTETVVRAGVTFHLN